MQPARLITYVLEFSFCHRHRYRHYTGVVHVHFQRTTVIQTALFYLRQWGGTFSNSYTAYLSALGVPVVDECHHRATCDTVQQQGTQ